MNLTEAMATAPDSWALPDPELSDDGLAGWSYDEAEELADDGLDPAADACICGECYSCSEVGDGEGVVE